MTTGDDNRGIQRTSYSQTSSGDESLKATRNTRELLGDKFDDRFSAKLAAEYQRMPKEQRDLLEGMTAKEVKEELRESSRKREKLADALRDAEPEWKKQSEAPKPEPTRIVGDGVTDVGKGAVLINKRPPVIDNDRKNGNTPDPSSIGNIPDPPSSGKYVLGSVDGVLEWIETSECEDASPE